jgi:hypothetical protein
VWGEPAASYRLSLRNNQLRFETSKEFTMIKRKLPIMGEAAASYWLSLRNNRLRFEASNEITDRGKVSTCSGLDLETLLGSRPIMP